MFFVHLSLIISLRLPQWLLPGTAADIASGMKTHSVSYGAMTACITPSQSATLMGYCFLALYPSSASLHRVSSVSSFSAACTSVSPWMSTVSIPVTHGGPLDNELFVVRKRAVGGILGERVQPAVAYCQTG